LEIKVAWVRTNAHVVEQVRINGWVDSKGISLVRCLWLHLIGRLLHRALERWLLLCSGLLCPLFSLRHGLLSATAKVSAGFACFAAVKISNGLTGDIFANESAGSPMALVDIVAQLSVRLLVLPIEEGRELAGTARVRSRSLHRELLRCLHPNGVPSLVCDGSGWRYRISRLDRRGRVTPRHIRSLWSIVLPLVGRSKWVPVIVGSVLNLHRDMSPISRAHVLVPHVLGIILLVVAVLSFHFEIVDVGFSVISLVVEKVRYAVVMVAVCVCERKILSPRRCALFLNN
jgi:hypothetical protein